MIKKSSLSKALALIVLTLFVSSGWAFETDQNSIIKGNLTLDPNAVSDASAKQGNLTVQGDTILGSDTTVSGVLTAESNLSVAGTTTSSGDINAGQTVNVAGDIYVGTLSKNIDSGGIRNVGGLVSYIQLTHGVSAASGNWYMAFFHGTNQVGVIYRQDNAVVYSTASDQRLKTNIQDAEEAGSTIDAIQVRQFDWKSDGSHQDFGMIAQELYEVAPEAVAKPNNPESMMSVDYSKLVPMLVKEIQSLRQRVEQLENSQ